MLPYRGLQWLPIPSDPEFPDEYARNLRANALRPIPDLAVFRTEHFVGDARLPLAAASTARAFWDDAHAPEDPAMAGEEWAAIVNGVPWILSRLFVALTARRGIVRGDGTVVEETVPFPDPGHPIGYPAWSTVVGETPAGGLLVMVSGLRGSWPVFVAETTAPVFALMERLHERLSLGEAAFDPDESGEGPGRVREYRDLAEEKPETSR